MYGTHLYSGKIRYLNKNTQTHTHTSENVAICTGKPKSSAMHPVKHVKCKFYILKCH